MSTEKKLNPHLKPRLIKAVVNAGVGSVQEKEHRTKIMATVELIAGQKAVATKAHKSIAGFKIREGATVGYVVTLRGQKMQSLLERLVNITLPRTRDFRGIKPSAVTEGGCLNIGIKDVSIFPEIKPESLPINVGMEITFVSTAKGKEESTEYFKSLGFPLEK